METSNQFVFLCNGARPRGRPVDSIELKYRNIDKNGCVNLQLPRFIDSVYHLSDRMLDLLELAAYVFAADRLSPRGSKSQLEFHKWSRSMHFHIKVRDFPFWSNDLIGKKLSEALCFMTGDREYVFKFYPGHSTDPVSLFDREEFKLSPNAPPSVILFSGGLDSLSGAVERLSTTEEDIYLISHSSAQPSISRTQKKLFDSLKRTYGDRIYHYRFVCGLSGERAPEETQRTRAFLFNSIAYVLARNLKLNFFYAYENGVTSINLQRRQDLMNARASRTTHPKTHALMSSFLSEVGGDIGIANPFKFKTKTDIFSKLKENGRMDLIGSSVSCSSTYKTINDTTHCGCCFQCIDRRIASYASGLDEYDKGIYAEDIVTDKIKDGESRTAVIDYIRQAMDFSKSTVDRFYHERISELVDVIDFCGFKTEQEGVDELWSLFKRHGDQVMSGLNNMVRKNEDLSVKFPETSLYGIITNRIFLKPDTELLSMKILELLRKSIPLAFQHKKPANENEVNDQVEASLAPQKDDYLREFPSSVFALAKNIPDHELTRSNLLIEVKYPRGKTTPAKISEAIAADMIKYDESKYILFIIYDPDRCIKDDDAFVKDIENKRECTAAVLR